MIPFDAIILYVSSTIIFLFLLPYYQSNPNIIVSHNINIPILSLLSLFISNFFYKLKVTDFIKNQKIQKSTAEFDELIKKILPESISFRLRKEGKITPMIQEATVVFVDFVSFSKITKSTNIQKVLEILDELFGEFDKILIQYNLEKIKTMGDGYMYAGGLFSNQTQLREAIDSAIEIQNLLEKKREELISLTNFPWEARIGIDCGNVISGVIGNWRFSFDIWGDTVNIAFRLVTECEPGKINISRNVFERIWFYNEYQLEPRGVLPIKNLGTIEMFYLHPSKKSIEK
ncbi:MAG: adenylate/guanylate cyclase domain-containing protein [Leptonema sp. (in: bacteria)]